jgi:hypothetical protein
MIFEDVLPTRGSACDLLEAVRLRAGRGEAARVAA